MLAVFLGYMQHIDSLPRVRLCVAVYLACLDFLIRRTLILGSCIGTESLVSAMLNEPDMFLRCATRRKLKLQ